MSLSNARPWKSLQTRRPSPNRLLLCLLLLWLSPHLQARPLTLEAAWQTALENNLTLQQQDLLLDQAREALEIRKTGNRPTVSATTTYGFTSEIARLNLPLSPPGGAIEAGVHNRFDLATTVEQPIFTGFRTRNLTESAREQLHARSARKEIVRNRIFLQVGQLYFQIQSNRLQQQVLQQALARTGHHLQKTRSLHAAEQASAFDTLEVANRALNLQTQVRKLVHLQTILLSRLGHQLNIDSVPDIPDLPEEPIVLELDSLAAYQDRAARNRPELKHLGFLKQVQTFRVRAENAARYPQVFASAAYHYARPGVNIFERAWMGYATVGLNLRWTLWDWRATDRRVRQARLETRRLDLESRQQYRDILQEVTEAYQYLETVRDQIRLQQRLVAQERERYRITRQNYEQGYATSLDLNAASNTLTEAELTLWQNRIEWLYYQLQMRYATGAIGPPSPGE